MPLSAGFEAEVRQRARRIRTRHRALSVAAAAACLTLLVGMVQILRSPADPELVAVAPDGPFLGWSAAGDGVDTGLLAEAVRVWDAQESGPHSAVRPLVAMQKYNFGPVVVAQGYDRSGAPRLAFFTADRGHGNALTLRADRPAPDPVRTQVVSLVSARLTAASGIATENDVVAIAVAMPGITDLQVDSTDVDQTLRQGGGIGNGRFVVDIHLTRSTSALDTTVTGFAGRRKVFEEPGEGAIGDPRPVRAGIVQRDRQQLTVTLDDAGPVRAGQLVAVRDGLVGRVKAVDRAAARATVALVTSPDFVCPVLSIVDIPGTARGTGDRLMLENIPLGSANDIYETNRLLAPDPAQGGSFTVGAITIGRATRDKPGDATSVELTPAVDVTKLAEVRILTPAD
ncbi:rod shape-determining protein MreC [Actinoplanes sp. NPDC051859]|uniref:rod shape-determining protein MreC n=1 Tax=Actinoplanes sp. NPDC051859 TaxID=3363909 RepID=UPI0037888159